MRRGRTTPVSMAASPGGSTASTNNPDQCPVTLAQLGNVPSQIAFVTTVPMPTYPIDIATALNYALPAGRTGFVDSSNHLLTVMRTSSTSFHEPRHVATLCRTLPCPPGKLVCYRYDGLVGTVGANFMLVDPDQIPTDPDEIFTTHLVGNRAIYVMYRSERDGEVDTIFYRDCLPSTHCLFTKSLQHIGKRSPSNTDPTDPLAIIVANSTYRRRTNEMEGYSRACAGSISPSHFSFASSANSGESMVGDSNSTMSDKDLYPVTSSETASRIRRLAYSDISLQLSDNGQLYSSHDAASAISIIRSCSVSALHRDMMSFIQTTQATPSTIGQYLSNSVEELSGEQQQVIESTVTYIITQIIPTIPSRLLADQEVQKAISHWLRMLSKLTPFTEQMWHQIHKYITV